MRKTVILGVLLIFMIGTASAAAPKAKFSLSARSGEAPLTVKFTDISLYSPTSWKWSFGDGTYSTMRNPTHTYSNAGVYTVSLQVANKQGSNRVTERDIITVKAPAVKADFVSDVISGYAPLKVAFSDRSAGNPNKWKWDFGDGQTSTERNPVHTFNEVGSYTVTLTSGSSSKTCKIDVCKTSTSYMIVYGKKVACGDGHPITMINNESARNPTYAELIKFIKADTTDRTKYDINKFKCGDYTENVHNNAEKLGYKAGITFLGFAEIDRGHFINVFQTVDAGLVYIDCTELNRINSDKRSYAEMGKLCTEVGIFDGKVTRLYTVDELVTCW